MDLLAQQSVMSIFVWSLVLIAILGAAILFMVWVRRRTAGPADGGRQNFTLSELRTMRESGQIDEEQFQKLRDAIIGASKRR